MCGVFYFPRHGQKVERLLVSHPTHISEFLPICQGNTRANTCTRPFGHSGEYIPSPTYQLALQNHQRPLFRVIPGKMSLRLRPRIAKVQANALLWSIDATLGIRCPVGLQNVAGSLPWHRGERSNCSGKFLLWFNARWDLIGCRCAMTTV